MAKRAPRKGEGRPTIFTQELADKICEQLAEGTSLRTVCIPDDMPAASTVFGWLRKNEEFVKQYARAKEESADALAEEIMDISDESFGVVTGLDKSDNARVQAMKLRVDTRKWIMSKMKPKKYGDKLDVVSDGKAIKGNTIILSDFKDETTGQQGL